MPVQLWCQILDLDLNLDRSSLGLPHSINNFTMDVECAVDIRVLMASQVYIWFRSELYPWRSAAAICWSVVCLPFFLMMLVLLAHCSLLEPLKWLQEFTSTLVSLHFVVMACIFAFGLVVVAWFSLPYLTVSREVSSSPLIQYVGLLRWSRLPLLVICALCGALCTWATTRLMGTQARTLTLLQDTPTLKRLVLNETHLFLVLCGIFSGLHYFTTFFIQGRNYCKFPHIQRLKLFQIRSEAIVLLQQAMWQSGHILKYYYILYFIFGSIPKAWVLTSFAIDTNPEVSPIDSILGLLNIGLLWKAYINTVFLTFSWMLAMSLVKVFHTENLEFPVIRVLDQHTNCTLPDAMACSYSPLLQHLAFYDLSLLARFSPRRRLELLSLSQPGGHPRVWTAVSGTALSAIRELTDRLREENSAIVARVTSLGAQQHQAAHHSIGDSSTSKSFLRSRMSEQSVNSSPSATEQSFSNTSVSSKMTSFASRLPLLSQLDSPCPEAITQQLFSSCQLQIWAVEGLSHIASKSYKEDKYGVVQATLASIFAALLDLHEAIEKHFKLTPSLTHRAAGQSGETSLPYTLQSVTKTSIYRLVNTYRAHLEDLRLGPDHFRRLQPFDDFNL